MYVNSIRVGNGNVAECFPEKTGLCQNEHVYQGGEV